MGVECVFQYLRDFPDLGIVIDHCDLDCVPELPVPDPLFIHQYPDALKENDPAIPKLFGPDIQISIFFDSDLAHDFITHRSCTGIVIFVGKMPVHQMSSYGVEFMAGKMTCMEVISLRYMLRCPGVRIRGGLSVW
jgi:hypothetical protein